MRLLLLERGLLIPRNLEGEKVGFDLILVVEGSAWIVCIGELVALEVQVDEVSQVGEGGRNDAGD